jgi:hypothetical protein
VKKVCYFPDDEEITETVCNKCGAVNRPFVYARPILAYVDSARYIYSFEIQISDVQTLQFDLCAKCLKEFTARFRYKPEEK